LDDALLSIFAFDFNFRRFIAAVGLRGEHAGVAELCGHHGGGDGQMLLAMSLHASLIFSGNEGS
jgi:hypothetical protein